MADRPHVNCVEPRDRQRCLAAILRSWLAMKESATGGVRAIFPDGMPHGGGYAAGASVPNPSRTWELTIDAILAHVGRNGAFILVSRLTGRDKSAEVSYEQLAAILTKAARAHGGEAFTAYEARQCFRLAVEIVHEHIERFAIGANARVDLAA